MRVANGSRGFTLIEVLVVLTIIATLLSLVTPRYFETIARSRETALRHDLAIMREAIDKFYGDTGTYPATLEELVLRKYLRAVPEDPITGSTASWKLVPPAIPEVKGAVSDVRSGAEDTALDGTSYAEW